MPSNKMATDQTTNVGHAQDPKKLTYAERVAQSNSATYGNHSTRSEPAHSVRTVAVTGTNVSSRPKQDSGMPKRSSTVRRRKAHDDLRMSAYAGKPLPPLPSLAVPEFGPAAGDQIRQQYATSRLADRRESMIDGAVRSVKDVAERCKSGYAKHKKKVRLSLAWEVEEIV